MREEGWSRRGYAAAIDAAPPPRTSGPSAPRRDGASPPAAEPPTPASAEPPPALPAPPPDPTAAELARWSIRQAAQALGQGRLADARALSQMAESLSRTAAREPRTPLEFILQALRDTAFRTEIFRIDPDNPDDPDLAVKRAYWGLS